ncbi:MAG: flavin reductase [Algiphilus sp.]|uniref:flavin reductase n=1 Tax=Algiphilus sp. TaxID=1872431 RepID=UPI0032EFB376
MTAEVATFDAGAFRKALGSFATGVTIITTRDAAGEPVGLTVNSFNSVSLNPPLVLWSLANNAMSLPAFRDAEYWAVHILSSDQEDLSTRFAKRGENKFADLELETGSGGIPLLPGCSARFQCRTASSYQGGDHLIFIGEVVAFDHYDNAPLVFHGGRYAHATQRLANKPGEPYLAGSFGEDFLGYLLGRSHFRFFSRIRPHLSEAGLSDEEFYVLSAMTLKPQMTSSDLDKLTAGVLDHCCEQTLTTLIDRHLLLRETDAAGAVCFRLTERGRELALKLISVAKAVESQVLAGLGPDEDTVLKSLLNQLLGVLDPDVGSLWHPDGEAKLAQRNG